MKIVCYMPENAIYRKSDIYFVGCYFNLETVFLSTIEAIRKTIDENSLEDIVIGSEELYQLSDLSRYFHYAIAITRQPLSRLVAKAPFIYPPLSILSQRLGRIPMNLKELIVLIGAVVGKINVGLESFCSYSVQTIERHIRSTADKELAIHQLKKWVANLALPGERTYLTDLAMVSANIADELILNAVMHAHPKYKHKSSFKTFEISKSEAINLEWCCDGNTLGIAVMDPFGSFRGENFYRKFMVESSHQDQRPRSLGLGLRSASRSTDRLFITVHPGRWTKVLVFLSLIQGSQSSRTKSVHYINYVA